MFLVFSFADSSSPINFLNWNFPQYFVLDFLLSVHQPWAQLYTPTLSATISRLPLTVPSSQSYFLSSRVKFSTACKMLAPRSNPQSLSSYPNLFLLFVFTVSINGNNQQNQKPGSRGQYLMSPYFYASNTWAHAHTLTCMHTCKHTHTRTHACMNEYTISNWSRSHYNFSVLPSILATSHI